MHKIQPLRIQPIEPIAPESVPSGVFVCVSVIREVEADYRRNLFQFLLIYAHNKMQSTLASMLA